MQVVSLRNCMTVDIIFKNRDAKTKEVLINEINDLMAISCDHLCIFFATEDNQNKPDWKFGYNKKYDSQGFYVYKEQGGIPSPWPDEINCIMGKSYKHFIWISKRIGEADEILFALIYSHELQHLKQSLKNKYLLIIANLLEHNDNYEDLNMDLPTEIECEGKAKEILVERFKQKPFEAFIKRMRECGSYDKRRYDRLLDLNIPANFDVEREIQQDICANKEKLQKIQKQREDTLTTSWNIDIDKLCSCRDPHNAIVSAITKFDQDDGVSEDFD